MRLNLNSQADGVARLFNGEGIWSVDALMEIAGPMIKHAQKDRQYLFTWNTPKWYLSEVYGYLKHKKELPEISRERKLELWEEAKKDKLLYLSLYLLEVL